jgi:hypothetical protein
MKVRCKVNKTRNCSSSWVYTENKHTWLNVCEQLHFVASKLFYSVEEWAHRSRIHFGAALVIFSRTPQLSFFSKAVVIRCHRRPLICTLSLLVQLSTIAASSKQLLFQSLISPTTRKVFKLPVLFFTHSPPPTFQCLVAPCRSRCLENSRRNMQVYKKVISLRQSVSTWVRFTSRWMIRGATVPQC